MRIDTHAHYYGESLFGILGRRAAVPRVEHADDQRCMVTSTSRFALRGGFVDLNARLAWMAAQDIGHQLITFPGALGPDVLPANESVPLVRDVNDELAAVCSAHPDRFSALAGLPLADIDSAIRELERACRVLGLRGAILPANYFVDTPGMAYLRPLLAAADSLGAHLMVHPGHRHNEDLAPRHYDELAMHRASTVDLHNAIAHAMVTLIHAEPAKVFPNASFQVVNLGGSFPMLVERLDHVVATRDPAAARPSRMIGNLLFDTASLGPRAVEMAVAIYGADNVMLGTDYPIFDSRVATEALDAAAITDAARASIGHGTARRLLRLPLW